MRKKGFGRGRARTCKQLDLESGEICYKCLKHIPVKKDDLRVDMTMSGLRFYLTIEITRFCVVEDSVAPSLYTECTVTYKIETAISCFSTGLTLTMSIKKNNHSSPKTSEIKLTKTKKHQGSCEASLSPSSSCSA